MTTQNLCESKGSAEREVYSNTGLLQETRKMSNKQPNFAPTGTRKIKNSLLIERENIMNIRAEINEKEIKVTIPKVTKTKMRFFQKTKVTIYYPLIKKKREKTQINKIKN